MKTKFFFFCLCLFQIIYLSIYADEIKISNEICLNSLYRNNNVWIRSSTVFTNKKGIYISFLRNITGLQPGTKVLFQKVTIQDNNVQFDDKATENVELYAMIVPKIINENQMDFSVIDSKGKETMKTINLISGNITDTKNGKKWDEEKDSITNNLVISNNSFIVKPGQRKYITKIEDNQKNTGDIRKNKIRGSVYKIVNKKEEKILDGVVFNSYTADGKYILYAPNKLDEKVYIFNTFTKKTFEIIYKKLKFKYSDIMCIDPESNEIIIKDDRSDIWILEYVGNIK